MEEASEVKRLLKVGARGGQSIMMMSYCIIRSSKKLKQAKDFQDIYSSSAEVSMNTQTVSASNNRDRVEVTSGSGNEEKGYKQKEATKRVSQASSESHKSSAANNSPISTRDEEPDSTSLRGQESTRRGTLDSELVSAFACATASASASISSFPSAFWSSAFNHHHHHVRQNVKLLQHTSCLSSFSSLKCSPRKQQANGAFKSNLHSGSKEQVMRTLAVSIILCLFDLLSPCWLLSSANRSTSVSAQQYRPEWPSKSLEQEIFLLNLEDGYFGCQVNESQDFLQLFELSRLCDGQTQCYLGTDELSSPLKCNNRDRCGSYQNSRGQTESIQCVHGVCLDGLCYCNDGYGGKACDIPDENECKFRPCDVFAHCTNTMGSYYCSCFPGYDGDGMHCQDINECEIPSLAALCQDNSECCNLPGHFVCKCKPGYQQSGQSQSSLSGAPSGNSSVSCTDIDECLDERVCGRGAICQNLPGSFRCSCPPGFTGDPAVECIDMDECRNSPCGLAAQCTNIPGGYRCSCAPGFERNPILPATLFSNIQTTATSANELIGMNSSLAVCLDVNECSKSGVCGVGAQCVNTQGAYFCQCPAGYTGNPKLGCIDIDECATFACGPNAICKNTPGAYQCECKSGYSGNAYLAEGCQDEDECLRKDACATNAQCFNTAGSHQCTCLSGYTGNPLVECTDIDECATSSGRNLCGPGAQCVNTPGGYRCACPEKFLARGTPEMGCERAAVDVGCMADYECTRNALCVNSTCQCKLGFQISGAECVDVDECQLSGAQALNFTPSSYQSSTTQRPFTKLNLALIQQQQQLALANTNLSTITSLCGIEASCVNTEGSFKCECKAGYEKLEPQSARAKCRDINECELSSPCGQNSRCFNTDGSYKCACSEGFIPIDPLDLAIGCKSPCDGVNCGQHATCKPHGEEAACVCKPGFTFDPNNIKLGCVDINECDTNYGPSGLCGQRALCTNIPGSYRCHCPPGYSGDAERYCEDINECDRKFGVFGQCGELAVCNNTAGSYTCSCAPGYTGNPRQRCTDIDECATGSGKARCAQNALCANTPGKFTCRCPPNHSGDPYSVNGRCVPDQPSCRSSIDCSSNELCRAGRCQCPYPAQQQQGTYDHRPECRHPCDRTECGPHATCQLDAELNALCVCDAGYMAPGDGKSAGCVDVNECIQGVTLSGITPLSALSSGIGGVALGPSVAAPSSNGSHPCGKNALCRNHPGTFDCVCPPGYSGDAYSACISINLPLEASPTTTTTRSPQAQTSTMVTQLVTTGSPQVGNYQQEPRTNACPDSCPRGYSCSEGQCVKNNQDPSTCRDNHDCKTYQSCELVQQQSTSFHCLHVCELNQCGPNARCNPLNHKPICSCNASAGFAGDPYDLLTGCQLLSGIRHQAIYQQTTASVSTSSSSQTAFSQQLENNLASSSLLTTKQDNQLLDYGAHRTTLPDLPSAGFDLGQQNINTTLERQHQQQLFDLQIEQERQTKRPSQPLIAYEVPLPTTPLLPQFSSYNQQQQQQYNISSQKAVELRQPQFSQINNNVVNQATGSTNGRQQLAQQQQSSQQNILPNKWKQQQQQNSTISNNNQLSTTNRQDFDSTQRQQQTLSTEEQQQQTVGHLDELVIPGYTAQTNNRSSSLISNTFIQATHKQVACTSDQHCPGNLFCLAIHQLADQNIHSVTKTNQKLCGCPSGYRREADFCYMQRVNCSSSVVCKAREECVSGTVLQQYYSQQQQQVSSQIFNTDEYSGICICPRGYKLTHSGIACIDRNECDEGTPCAVGAICQNKIGSYECVCPPGSVGEPYTKTCEPIVKQECRSNVECPSDRECDLVTQKCVSPCYVCGPRAICTAANHLAICLCPPRYTGNAIDLVYGCQEPLTTTIQPGYSPNTGFTTAPPTLLNPTITTNSPIIGSSSTATTSPAMMASSTTAVGTPVTTLLPATTIAPTDTTTPELVEFRTIPPSELFVMCLADGIQVEVQLGGFDGIIYVKGHSQDPKCRKLVVSSNANEFVDFKVQFGHCDLIHRDGEAGFVLVIQKHPKLVTYRARAYHVKCVYNTGERTVTLGFNVSMITTSGTIANTGPPPTCLMSITALDGREVTSAEIGQDLLLRVDVQPDSIYGGFARSCEAKTMDDEGEYQYEVTDANGCSTDPSIFSDWKYDQQRKSLVARFNAFKFPSSNNLRFQCNIRVCFGSCPAVNCNGIDAYGRKRRRREAPALAGSSYNSSLDDEPNFEDDSSSSATSSDEMIVTEAFKEGALREEVMVQSNAILTFDKKESSLPQQRPKVEDIEFVCLPRLGIMMSIVLVTLLALLALAIGTSFWCFTKRGRTRRSNGPLPHPIDFPNPLLRSSSASTLREPIYGP